MRLYDDPITAEQHRNAARHHIERHRLIEQGRQQKMRERLAALNRSHALRRETELSEAKALRTVDRLFGVFMLVIVGLALAWGAMVVTG